MSQNHLDQGKKTRCNPRWRAVLRPQRHRCGPILQICPLQHPQDPVFPYRGPLVSCLNYCNSLLSGLRASASNPLQFIQNTAACFIYNLPKFSHVTTLQRDLHWLSIAARVQFNMIVLAFKLINRTAPLYLQTYYISWPAGTAIAESKQSPLCKVATPLCFGTSMVELAPDHYQDSGITLYLPQNTQDSFVQTSSRLHIVWPTPLKKMKGMHSYALIVITLIKL